MELARIVSGREAPAERRRSSSLDPEPPVTSEADIARDLEAELLSDLQATFAAAGVDDIDDSNDQPPFRAPEEAHEGNEAFPFEHESPPAALDPLGEEESADSYPEETAGPPPEAPDQSGDPLTVGGVEAAAPANEFETMALRGNRGGPAFNPHALAAPQGRVTRSDPATLQATGAPAVEQEFHQPLEEPDAGSQPEVQESWAYDNDPGLAQPEYDPSSAELGDPDAFEAEVPAQQPQRPPVAAVSRPRHRDPRLERDPYGEARARRSSGRRTYAIIGVLAVVAVGIASALVLGGGESTDGEPPLITADNGPIRVLPEPEAVGDEAGNAVFDRVDPDGAPAADENLLEGAEPVVDLTIAPEANDGITQVLAQNGDGVGGIDTEPRMVRTVTVLPDGRIIESEAAPAVDAPAIDGGVGDEGGEAANPAPAVDVDPPVIEAADPLAIEPVNEDPVAVDAPQIAAGPNVPSVGDPIAPGFYVQVSAQGSEAAAQDQLAEFRTRSPSLLGSRAAVIQRAELPQGTYFRVQFGPLSTQAEAEQLRQSLSAAGIDSFVTSN